MVLGGETAESGENKHSTSIEVMVVKFVAIKINRLSLYLDFYDGEGDNDGDGNE